MKRTFFAVFSLLMGLIAALPTSAQVFFKVEGNGLATPSYIFGTHHLAPLKVFADQKGGREAFSAATQVVGEIDMKLVADPAVAMSMQQYTLAPADSTLSKLLGPDMATYSAKFAQIVPGMTLEMLDPMRPMVPQTIGLLTIVSQQLEGFNPEEQLDTWFQLQGALEEKAIIPLETPQMQAQLLYSSVPLEFQVKSLKEMLDNPDKMVENARNLNEAYMSKDLAKMLRLSQEGEDPEERVFMEALVDKRNADWLTKLPAIFSQGPTFVAVGALHLAGPQGIVEGLRNLGYTVTAIE